MPLKFPMLDGNYQFLTKEKKMYGSYIVSYLYILEDLG